MANTKFKPANKIEVASEGNGNVPLSEEEDEALWDAQFAASHDVLQKLHDETLEEFRQGKTIEIGEDPCVHRPR